MEHIIPVSIGGTTDPWNCIPVCGPCNLSKGGDHLLDWWDKNYGTKYEYRLEKIFLYITSVLNKSRSIRISTKEEIDKLKELECQEEIDEYDFSVKDKELDFFTFLYQLLNHLSSSGQISIEKINEYIELFQIVYNKNKEFPRLDREVNLLQNKFTKYLKNIGVVKHYEIAFEYVDKINDLNIIKENVDNISKYLLGENIGNLINNNPDTYIVNPLELEEKINYIKSNGLDLKETIVSYYQEKVSRDNDEKL